MIFEGNAFNYVSTNGNHSTIFQARMKIPSIQQKPCLILLAAFTNLLLSVQSFPVSSYGFIGAFLHVLFHLILSNFLSDSMHFIGIPDPNVVPTFISCKSVIFIPTSHHRHVAYLSITRFSLFLLHDSPFHLSSLKMVALPLCF